MVRLDMFSKTVRLLFYASVSALLLLALLGSVSVAHAQDPTPTPIAPPNPVSSALNEVDKIYVIGQLATDLLQGKLTPNPNALFSQSKQSAADLLNQQGAGIFFLDFANPNLGINQFAAEVARNLLALTPLYVFAYLIFLVYAVWKERPIPNPIIYAGLVILVMLFLAAFAVIMQGMSQLGRALAVAISGGDQSFFSQATLLDQITRALENLQQNNIILAVIALVVSIILFVIVLGQLVYRGIALVILRLLGVLVIPFSILLEGVRPRAAGRVISGFFESWFDLVTKVAVLLIVIALAASQAFVNYVWLVLPAGLLIVVLSWKFFSIPFVMVRDATGRAWTDLVPATVGDTGSPLPSSAEAARAREIDSERKRMVEE